MARLMIPVAVLVAVLGVVMTAEGLMPYTRTPWEMMNVMEDPFRILEQAPLSLSKNINDALASVRADWKETPSTHLISIDIPGMKKEDIKIEVEENRVLRVSGERKQEEEQEGDKWHRVERTCGKFWRQFRLPANADLDKIRAHLGDGVLRVTVPKLTEDKKRQPKVIDIVEDKGAKGGEDIKATKVEM